MLQSQPDDYSSTVCTYDEGTSSRTLPVMFSIAIGIDTGLASLRPLYALRDA